MYRCLNSTHSQLSRWASTTQTSGSSWLATTTCQGAPVSVGPPVLVAPAGCQALPSGQASQTTSCVVSGGYLVQSATVAQVGVYSSFGISSGAPCPQAPASGGNPAGPVSFVTYDITNMQPCQPFLADPLQPSQPSSFSLGCDTNIALAFDNLTESCLQGIPSSSYTLGAGNNAGVCSRQSGAPAALTYLTAACAFVPSASPSTSQSASPSPPPPLSYIFEVSTNITLPYQYARLIANSSLVTSSLRISIAAVAGVPLTSTQVQSISTAPRQQNPNTVVSVYVVVSVISPLSPGGATADALLGMTPASLSAVSSAVSVSSGGVLPSAGVSSMPMPAALVALCQVSPSDTYGFIQCPLPYAKAPSPSAAPSQWPAPPFDAGPPIVFGVVSVAIIAALALLLYTLNRRGHVSNMALAALRKTGVLAAMGAATEDDDGEYDEETEGLEEEEEAPPPPPPAAAPPMAMSSLRAYRIGGAGSSRRELPAEPRETHGDLGPAQVRGE